MDCGHIFFFLSKGITVTVNWEITEMALITRRFYK